MRFTLWTSGPATALLEYESKLRLSTTHDPGYIVFDHESGRLYLNTDDTAEIVAAVAAATAAGTTSITVEPDDEDFTAVQMRFRLRQTERRRHTAVPRCTT
jgi:hypothetical protein